MVCRGFELRAAGVEGLSDLTCLATSNHNALFQSSVATLPRDFLRLSLYIHLLFRVIGFEPIALVSMGMMAPPCGPLLSYKS